MQMPGTPKWLPSHLVVNSARVADGKEKKSKTISLFRYSFNYKFDWKSIKNWSAKGTPPFGANFGTMFGGLGFRIKTKFFMFKRCSSF